MVWKVHILHTVKTRFELHSSVGASWRCHCISHSDKIYGLFSIRINGICFSRYNHQHQRSLRPSIIFHGTSEALMSLHLYNSCQDHSWLSGYIQLYWGDRQEIWMVWSSCHQPCRNTAAFQVGIDSAENHRDARNNMDNLFKFFMVPVLIVDHLWH